MSLALSGTDKVTQANMGAGVAGNGPAFSAYLSTATFALSNGVWTKVPVNTEEFDTANVYDSSANYRFQPSIAGYYHIDGMVEFSAVAGNAMVSIYKNGAQGKRGARTTTTTNNNTQLNVSALVYLNGTTDYVELWAYSSVALNVVGSPSDSTYFQGHLARAA